MKVEQDQTIGLFDIDYRFKLQVQATARFFQEVTTSQSESLGLGPEALFKQGVVWFLHRLEIEFFRHPDLYEDVRVITWPREFKRFKGTREYVMTSSKGEIARGSSVWIFYDLKRSRLSKIPPDILDRYDLVSEKWFDKEIDDWMPCGRIEPENQVDISLRHSDYDVNGHVNNTVYFGFLETLYQGNKDTAQIPVRNVKIRYIKEIDRGIKSVRTGWQKKNGVYQYNVFDGSNLYADGEITPME